jgi:hypothetical protein
VVLKATVAPVDGKEGVLVDIWPEELGKADNIRPEAILAARQDSNRSERLNLTQCSSE